MEAKEKSILIVEDDTSLLEILFKELNREGFEVLTARDGEEGLRIAIEERPDLILLDILMPKKDGLTMLRELREDAWGKGAAVILLSNLDSSESITGALHKGALDYIVKSRFDTSALIKKIKGRLECQ